MKATLKLYELSQDYLSALDALAEIDDLPPEAIAIEEAKQRMDGRAKATAAQVRRLKDYLKAALERTGLKPRAADLALRAQNNPAAVIVDDEAALPGAFTETVTVTKVRKAEFGKALKAGEEIRGAHLSRTTRLVIR